MKRMLVGALVLVPLLPGFSVGQSDPFFEGVRNKVKAVFGFGGWPGKNGALKAGFIFKPEDFAALAAFTVSRDEKSVVEGISGTESITVERSMRLTSGSDRLFVLVTAAVRSTDNAQELLVNTLTGTQALPQVAWRRGERLGVTVGDLNF